MKNIALVLLLFTHFVINAQNRINHSFYLYDTFDSTDMLFNDVFNKYNLDTNLPSVMIVWGTETCWECTDIVNRYASCDTTKFNLILVNLDGITGANKDTVNGVAITNYDYKLSEETIGLIKEAKDTLKTAESFYLFSNKGGLDKQLNISGVPFIILFNNNLEVIGGMQNVNGFPSKFFSKVYSKEVLNYLKGSPMDIVEYSLEKLLNGSGNLDIINKSLLEIEGIVKSNSYKDHWLTSKRQGIDFTGAKLYISFCLVQYRNGENTKAKTYLNSAKKNFMAVKKAYDNGEYNDSVNNLSKLKDMIDLINQVEKLLSE